MATTTNKGLKTFLIIFLAIVVIAGVFVGIFFALSGNSNRYYFVKINDNSGQLNLSSESNSLAPDSLILSRPVTVGITKESSQVYLRAKIVFESDSEDNRVLSFVNQLNFSIGLTTTFSNNYYSWKYYESDNSFYLMGKDNSLKVVSFNDGNYSFLENLKVPSNLEQIPLLNSDGNNVQVGENIVIRIIFEAIQSSDILNNQKASIENTSEIFNNFATFSDGKFTSQNGYITSYTGTSSNLILPKLVGDDYIIGIKPNAFAGTNVEKVIIPGNYIYFKNNCFYGLNNLSFVALKSETPIKLETSSFTSNAKLEIYATNNLLTYINNNYSTLAYFNNFIKYTEISSDNIDEIQDKTIKAIYAPNVKQFNGNFKKFTSLKIFIAPSLTTINAESFMNLNNLLNVDTANATVVGENAFNNCTNLINVSLSNKLETIGDRAFINCNNLLNINFAKNLSNIPVEAFRNCTSLQEVYLLNSNLMIDNGAFYNCTNLKTVNISNLNTLNDYAFSYCTALKYFNILDFNIDNISENGFTNTNNNIINFVFNDEIKSTNFANKFIAYANNVNVFRVQNYILTKFVGNIKNLNITEFKFFGEIKSLGNNLFKDNTILNSIIIPSNVRNIGYSFVSNCENLISITFNSSIIPNFHEDSFDGAKQDIVIYVPSNLVEIYKATLNNKFSILAI